MSKNVAVFVDVANIFYAAKAAGVDIDYVTLLKSATAGRDLVRAYAYTGLDPDNDNQLKFHDFLRKSGFKVVSKDIRKYGDGRIKANLDIELVVDLMRLAQHIDIAVVVSGDGDFAPAIKAVQQMGVRVDVISFSGNTSSDLKEVADDFYDIQGLARVEKGVRSGRRVASEDDLSMTAVPEKESEMGARRRRGGTGRRDGRDDLREAREAREPRESREGRNGRVRPTAVAAPADDALPGNVIVLPGERLSRAAAGPVDQDLAEEELAEVEEGPIGEAGEPREEDGDGRRRRRRRGGRGRGRGRRADGTDAEGGELVAESSGLAAVGEAPDEEEFLEEELPTLPQHSTFGSVWDTQIGLPPKPVVAAGPAGDEDEEYDDEPEVPEYLLAERRQQGRGNRGNRGGRTGGRQGGRAGGYQSAIERERFGRSGPALYGGGNTGGGQRTGGRPQGGGDRYRGGGQGRRPHPQSQPGPVPRERDVVPTNASAEPWSEVPADVQELLRAEMARRQGGTRPAPAPAPRSERSEEGRGGRRTPRPTAVQAVSAEPAASAEPVTEAPRPTRRRPTKATAAEPAASAEPVAAEPVAEAPKPTRRRSTKATTAEPAASAEPAAPAEPVAEAPKPTRKRTTKATEPAATPAEPAAEAPKPTRRRSTKAAAGPTEA